MMKELNTGQKILDVLINYKKNYLSEFINRLNKMYMDLIGL